MVSQFEGFTLNDEKVIKVNDENSTINFDKLTETLKKYSSQQESFESTRWMFEGGPKFLDGKVEMQPTNRVVYTSVPRSGNSFLRKYFEQITGVVTGSDVTIN